MLTHVFALKQICKCGLTIVNVSSSLAALLWLLTGACIKTRMPQMAKKAIELVEQRLSKDGWPEYYDGKTWRYIGKQARKY